MAIPLELKKISLFVAIAVLVVLSVIIIWPIVQPLIVGLLLAYIFLPFYKKIFKKVKNRNLAASLVIAIVIIVLAIPTWFFLPVIIKQSFDFYLYLQEIDFFAIIQKVAPHLLQQNIANEITLSINKFVTGFASKFFEALTKTVFNLPIIGLKVTVGFIVFFFGIRDADKIKEKLKKTSPFSSHVENKMLRNFDGITKSIIYSFIITGIIQGVLTGIGLLIFKVPHPAFLTLIATFAAILPILGAWVVWFPASIYLIMIGHTSSGIGLFLYGAILVSWIDNILRPYMVVKNSDISTSLVLVGMIGGLITTGILGLIIGPLILSYLSIIFESYKEGNLER